MKKNISALKRQRQNLKRKARNAHVKTAVKSQAKKVRSIVLSKDLDSAEGALKAAMSAIDKASSKGVIHRRNAARKISRLSRLVHQSRQATP